MSGAGLLMAAVAAFTPFPDSELTPEQRVAPGTSRVLELRAADPKAGNLPWTVRVARSTTGLECSTVGQANGADFGLVGLDGAFRALPEANADACGEPGRLIGERVFAARTSEHVRTVVYGVAGTGLQRVTLTPANGRERVVPHTPEGGFVSVLRGYPEDAAATVKLTLAGGVTRTHRFPAAKGFTVPDPDGGRAWSLNAFSFGEAPGTRTPRLRPGCVMFRTARSVPGERNVSSSPVCGLEPARRGVKLKPLYFDTRVLRGDGPGKSFMGGDWNGHPARMAVYGAARGSKRIVVRAGRFTRTVAPRLNQTFLVFLPRGTDIRTVRVTVDGKRYGPRHGLTALPRQLAPGGRASAVAAQADTAPRRGRLPDGRYSSSYVHYRVRNARMPIRIEDATGGPPWVLRVFDADRITLQQPARTLARGRVVGRNRCVQVGRLQDGRFGWVFGDGQFRATPDVVDRLLQCTSRKVPRAVGGLLTTLGARPVPAGTIVWGQLPGAKDASVAGTGAADGPAAVAGDGAFLRVAGPDAHAVDGARVSGGGKTLQLGPRTAPSLPPELRTRIKFPTLVPGTQAIEAPAPDPAGGPPWAVPVAQTVEGTPCTGGRARVVGGRVGDPDLDLGVFTESVLSGPSCRPLTGLPNAEYPCSFSWGGGNAEELEGSDSARERGRIERRLLAGRTFVDAQCRADVERVTLETPRDRRTLVPSPFGRALLAVYDGSFIDGDLTVTMHLQGGRTVTQSFPLGGP